MRVAIIDHGSGNLRSAQKAFERAALEAGLSVCVTVTATPEEVARADRIVLPGVGAFIDCMEGLQALEGMRETLEEAVRRRARPFLGICVGMQMMADRGLEHGAHEGMGWIPGEVAAIKPDDPALKIPHMGWNVLDISSAHPVLQGLGADHAYFVHSYSLRASCADHVIARTDYGGWLTAAVARDNMVGTQFHPEKSQKPGLSLIRNFLSWSP